jgi:hypothetical protein
VNTENFGFHERWEISWLGEYTIASQGGFGCVELVSYLAAEY